MDNKNPKILLAAPISNKKDYIIIEWLIHVSNLTYQNYDILLCDNSIDKTYHKQIQKMGFNCLYVDPTNKHSRQFVTESQLRLREYFLKHDYDIYLSVECDNFPPRNFIEKLLAEMELGCKIIGIPYYYGFGKESNLVFQYFEKDENNEYRSIWPTLDKMIEFLDGKVKQVYENGIGCTMISREIIEKIPWRYEEGHTGFADTHFYKDLWNAGYDNWIDTSMICFHCNSNWANDLDHVGSKDINWMKN